MPSEESIRETVDLKAWVESELEPGEQVTWIGQPVAGRYARVAWVMMAFGIAWLIFLYFLVGKIGSMGSGTKLSLPMVFEVLLNVIPLPLGLVMISSPYWVRRRAKRIVYALTDRRAIIFTPRFFSGVSVRSFMPSGLMDITRTEHGDRTGDVVFTRDVSSNGEGATTYTKVGFLSVPEVRQVERLVRALTGKDKSEL